ncbi:MAG: 4-(cytidine 5'-diphospho)-2-C-methyl-D-erythritol kinase [Planctomycetia bacterium]|nr:4-(cytidine 5'-diphospho)-2-C-methyl-D-erythritol kinase [Planctomycetia bacterium]
MDSLTLRSPAKLNLFLEVIRRREDRFHELDTLMVPVTLSDTLTIRRRTDDRIFLKCHGNDTLPCDGRNLIVKAIQAYCHSAGIPTGFEVILEKRIPVEAGLGGGSGNAATTLTAIHRLSGEPEIPETLRKLGATLGSDVPFFFHGGAARCRGRGEVLEPIPDPPVPFHFVLVRPPEGFSTALAYRYCRTAEECGDRRTIDPILKAWDTGDPEWLGRTCFNRLESAVCPRSEAVRRTMELLRRERTCGVGMSGSGTCCFAICRDERESRELAERLSEQIGTRFPERKRDWFVRSIRTGGREKGKKSENGAEIRTESLE